MSKKAMLLMGFFVLGSSYCATIQARVEIKNPRLDALQARRGQLWQEAIDLQWKIADLNQSILTLQAEADRPDVSRKDRESAIRQLWTVLQSKSDKQIKLDSLHSEIERINKERERLREQEEQPGLVRDVQIKNVPQKQKTEKRELEIYAVPREYRPAGQMTN